MDQQTIRAISTSVGYFVEFVEWIYQVKMPPEHHRVLESEVLSNWANPDQSTRQLVVYVLDQRSRVAARPDSDRAAYRAQAQQIFRRVFSELEPNDRGRILGLLYQMLEQLRPGCTGALSPFVPAPAAAAAAPLPANAYGVPLPAVPGAAAPLPAPPAPVVVSPAAISPYGLPHQPFPGAAGPLPPAAPPAAAPARFAAQTAYAAAAEALVPKALQDRMETDMRDHQIAREKYQWDAINRNIQKIWQ